MRTKRRLLSALLSLALVLSLLPVAALADNVDTVYVDGTTGSTENPGYSEISAGVVHWVDSRCTGDKDCPLEPGEAHRGSCPMALGGVIYPGGGGGGGTFEILYLCTGEADCQAQVHNRDCLSQCTKSNSCPNTEGVASAHKSGCPRAQKAEVPTQPIVLTLKNPTVSFKQEGRDITVSYNISSDPAVSPFLCEPFFHGVQILLTVGTGAPLEQGMTGPYVGAGWTFKNAVPTADKVGSGPLPVSVEVNFFYAPEIIQQGGKSYIIQGNDTRATASGTCTPSGEPEEAREIAGEQLLVTYDPATGALDWYIEIIYQNGVKPGPTTKINQFANEHFILTLKRGGTVVEDNIHFDTVQGSATTTKVNRVQQHFVTTYKPAQALTPGEYTIELLNERSMGDGGNLTGKGTFTVGDSASKPASLKSVLEGLVQAGFTAASKASDVRDAILGTISGSNAAAKAKNLLSSLQNGGSSADELLDLIREAEQKFLKATGISVNFKSSDSLSISALGLGLNSATSSEITLETGAPGKNHGTIAGARASLGFSLSVSGLSNNKTLTFPVQVSLKLPADFTSKDPVYVLRYNDSGTSEKLAARVENGNAVFTTDTPSGDFVLVQEGEAPSQNTAAGTSDFSDVPASHAFHKEISWVSQKGVMNGSGNGRFNPGGNVNRQQLWMVLARMAGANPANMAEARTWAISSGISDGTTPTGSVSRQQLVTMLYRYAVNQGITLSGAADLGTYSDNGTVSGYAKDALAWAVGNGIVGGTSDGRLNPQGSATRAHFAAFLYRFGQKTGM